MVGKSPEGAIFEVKKKKKNPEDGTGKLKCSDVGFFRFWEQFVRRISNSALMEEGVDCFHRKFIIKHQSFVNFQFTVAQY